MGRSIIHRLRRTWPANLFGTLVCVRTAEPIAALTFDDGPDPVTTPKVIAILGRYGARATFFMLGRNAAAHPEVVRQVAEAGHAVALHSWDHAFFPGLSSRQRIDQIRRSRRALEPYGTALFRPPYGHSSWGGAIEARLMGCRLVGWSVDSGDWWNPDAEAIHSLLTGQLRPGSIVLFHDRITLPAAGEPSPALVEQPLADRTAMCEALESFLKEGADRLRFVTVPEALQSGHAVTRFRQNPGATKSRRSSAADVPLSAQAGTIRRPSR